MFKSFTHGERTVNVIISKGEDCGVIKESVDKLRNIVNEKDLLEARQKQASAARKLAGASQTLAQADQAAAETLTAAVEATLARQTAEENQEN